MISGGVLEGVRRAREARSGVSLLRGPDSALPVNATIQTVGCSQVFPGTFDRTDRLGRLHAPFGYWNATGLVAAIGLPPCLWAGARRDAGRALRALAVPAIAILAVVLVLSYSRGVLLAVAVGLACWFAVVPLRLRSALVLGIGCAGAAAVTAWALATHAITHDRVPLHSRVAAGHTLGVILVAVIVVLTIAVLLRFKINSIWLILAGAAIGVLRFWLF